SSC
ncbi:heavy-metal-associated domain protein, partial [Vibrio parahaemolyticus EKP-028]